MEGTKIWVKTSWPRRVPLVATSDFFTDHDESGQSLGLETLVRSRVLRIFDGSGKVVRRFKQLASFLGLQ